MQGQATLAERFAPGPPKTYQCNLEAVGQFKGEGAFDGLAVYHDCAYYSTFSRPQTVHPGVVVLDVSNSRRPEVAKYLASPAMLDAQESLEATQTGRLLLGSKPPDQFDLYDLSGDCRKPVLKKSFTLPGLFSHAGEFTADGRTFYGAKWQSPPDSQHPPHAAVFALDTTNADAPNLLATWIPSDPDWVTHGVTINKEGTRAYVALIRIEDDRAKSRSPNGLAILDISDIQKRQPSPNIRLISTLFWEDTHLAQLIVQMTIERRPYVAFADIAGAIGIDRPPPGDACKSGRPGHGFARIIAISDETAPRIVSKLMLEVAAPANCSNVIHDPVTPLGYGIFGCNVDSSEDSKLLACGGFESGLRVFDVRNPRQPKEVAYYKPAGGARGPDPVVVVPQFRNNGQEIWFTSVANGFQVVRFSDRFKAAEPGLFENRR